MTPAASLAAVVPAPDPTGEHGAQAAARLQALFDPGTMHPLRAGVEDGVLAGGGLVDGRPVLAWAQDGAHRGGSLGVRGGETIATTIRRADERGVPVVGLPHSGGARLQEGTGALTAYAAIFREQARARVPQISVVCGPCAGGAAGRDRRGACDRARARITCVPASS